MKQIKEFIYNHAFCLNVLNAEIIDVQIDVGFGFHTQQRIRLLGLNMKEEHGAAYEKVKSLCLAKSVQIKTVKKDRNGIWLGLVFVEGKCLNDVLIKEGLEVEAWN